MLESSMCHSYFQDFFHRFHFEIPGLSYFLDMTKSSGLKKKLCCLLASNTEAGLACGHDLILVNILPRLNQDCIASSVSGLTIFMRTMLVVWTT